MVQKEVASYVRRLLHQGYTPAVIRTQLLRYGYSQRVIDEALRQAHQEPAHHVIQISPKIIVALVIILGVIGGIAFFLLQLAVSPTALLDVSLQPTTTEVEPGGALLFVKEITNLGGKQRFDVQLTHTVIDPQTSKTIVSREEAIAVETSASAPTQIALPQQIEPGRYVVETLAKYDGKQATASFSFIVEAKRELLPSCIDDIQNQGEEGVDCGGPCPRCEDPEDVFLAECPGGCNDFDSCTGDRCVNGRCVHDAIVPCCGDFNCEKGETTLSCPEDCAIQTVTKRPEQVLSEAVDIASADPGRAAKLCSTILVSDIADQCYGIVSDAATSQVFCEQIQDSERRDGCYLTYAQSTDDYSVCDKLENRLYKTSCNSFKNLKNI